MQEQCKVKIMPLHDNFVMPAKQFDAACYDVIATEINRAAPDVITCSLGFSTEIPKGWKGIIVPRSGQTKTKWVMLNSPGQIDCDYRGLWMVKFTLLNADPYTIEEYKQIGLIESPFQVGDRVAQIYFEKVNSTEFELVDKLEESQRDSGGFGSTGK